MANRVFRNLSAWTRMDDEALAASIADLEGSRPSARRMARARRLFAEALETPGGLKIQTIHAFCEAVLHQFALEANIAGHFELLDPAMEEALVAEARRAVIVEAVSGRDAGLAEAFAHALDAAGEAGFEELLAEIVRRRDGLRAFIVEIGADRDFAGLFERHGISPAETGEDHLRGLWPDAYFDKTFAQDLADKAARAGKARAGEFALKLARACAEREPDAIFEALSTTFLTGAGIGKPRSADTIMAVALRQDYPDFGDQFGRFCGLLIAALDRRALHATLRDTRAALIVADRLIGRYERLKNGRGFLDFNDLIARTVALLQRQDAAAWVHYKLDQGIDHILLDEAQDTGPDQWQVVTGLASEFFAGRGQRYELLRTLFAVGDEKQSIYSFQGAEPAAFFMTGSHYRRIVGEAGGRFEQVRLDRSFRSTDDVLAAVDLVFSREEARAGLTIDPEPVAHRGVRSGEPGHVELWPSLGPEGVDEPDDWTLPIGHASAPAVRLADQIAATIDGWLGGREVLEGRGRPIAPGDIMVLVRKRDSFVHALSRALKNRGVPVGGADRLVLGDHIAVQDLVALGRFLLQPRDDLGFAAVLKSPIFDFDEDRLFHLAAGRAPGRSLHDALADDPASAKAVERLSVWRVEASSASPFAFYASVLGRDGVRKAMVARLGHEAGDILDEFLSFCLASERAGCGDLESLLALLEGGGPEIKRELDQDRGEVRIMTAHAAKGLEAPVVFLVDSGGAPFHASHLPRLMTDPPAGRGGHAGYLWRTGSMEANSVLSALGREARRKAEQEYRRLLYVGMTRAEDRLVMCGYHGSRGQPEGCWHRLVGDALAASPDTAELDMPGFDQPALRYRITPPGATAHTEAAAIKEAGPPPPGELGRTLAPETRLPRPLAPSGALAFIEGDASPAAPGSPVLDERPPSVAASRGASIHRLLQVLPDMPAGERAAAARRYLESVGREWPAPEREATLDAVLGIIADVRFAALFGPGSRAEVWLAGTVGIGGGERAVAGKLDRVAVGDEDVRVVDFKTGRPPPSRIEDVPALHVAQLALYRALLRQLYPGRTVRACLLYTESAAMFELPSERLDHALVAIGAA
jgi:ATP-dependent helicase/nuclease subunit A